MLVCFVAWVLVQLIERVLFFFVALLFPCLLVCLFVSLFVCVFVCFFVSFRFGYLCVRSFACLLGCLFA